MDDLTIREAMACDALHMAPWLRDSDVNELKACHGNEVNVTDVLTRAVVMSGLHCWVAEDAGGPVALFGVSPVGGMPGVGSPWLLGADRMTRYKGFLVKQIREYIDLAHRRYPSLINRVDANNTGTIEWLKHLGFQVGDPTPHGPYDAPFRFFTREAE